MIRYFVEYKDFNAFIVTEVSDHHKQWIEKHPKAKEITIHEYLSLKARSKQL